MPRTPEVGAAVAKPNAFTNTSEPALRSPLEPQKGGMFPPCSEPPFVVSSTPPSMRPMSRSHRCTGAESAFVDGPSLHPRSCSPVHAASLLRHRRRDRITSNVEVIDERPFLRRWRKGPSCSSRRHEGMEGTYVIDERPFLRRRRKGVSSTRTSTPGDGGTCAGGRALRAVPSSPRERGDVSSPGEMTKITASDLPFFGRSARSVLFQASVNWRSGIRQREDPSQSTGASSR